MTEEKISTPVVPPPRSSLRGVEAHAGHEAIAEKLHEAKRALSPMYKRLGAISTPWSQLTESDRRLAVAAVAEVVGEVEEPEGVVCPECGMRGIHTIDCSSLEEEVVP